jgi:hypothetical protein
VYAQVLFRGMRRWYLLGLLDGRVDRWMFVRRASAAQSRVVSARGLIRVRLPQGIWAGEKDTFMAATTTNQLDDTAWEQLKKAISETCTRITPRDFADCEQRLDLLVAKVQNRHWVDRDTARQLVRDALAAAG